MNDINPADALVLDPILRIEKNQPSRYRIRG
jgi:hypothetical protein